MNIELTGMQRWYAVEHEGINYTIVETYDENTDSYEWEVFDCDADTDNDVPDDIKDMLITAVENFNRK